jgi:hypothetical protein
MSAADIPRPLIDALAARTDDPDCVAAARMIERLCKEIDVLQGIAGAVSPGQTIADIKEYLRTLKKDKPDGSRESAAS